MSHRSATRRPLTDDLLKPPSPPCAVSGATGASTSRLPRPCAPRRRRLPNLPLWDQGAACCGAAVARLVGTSCARLGRSRLLRAAWQPCSRGPARRARMIATGAQPPGGDADIHMVIRRRGHRPGGAFPSARDGPRHAGPVKAAARRCAMASGQPGPLHHGEIGGQDEEQAGE